MIFAKAGIGPSPAHGTTLANRGYRRVFGINAQKGVAFNRVIPFTKSGLVAAK